jgi:hypothetical protein
VAARCDAKVLITLIDLSGRRFRHALNIAGDRVDAVVGLRRRS